jgi:predicted RNase H-like nuclease (RuvC/YqgF family)
MAKTDYEKQIQCLERNVAFNVKKVEKLTEEKKAKAAQMKEMAKSNSEATGQLQRQVSELEREVKKLRIKAVEQASELEKVAKTETKRDQKAEKQLEEFESKLAEKNREIDNLENTKENLLDSLERIQKLLQVRPFVCQRQIQM